MTDNLVGKKIGPYELQTFIGEGGMAVVYRAYQDNMKRDVAMKIVSLQIAQESRFVERFKHEAQLIAGLEHAHIVPVYEYGVTDDGFTFLTMRYLKGGTLAECIHRDRLMPLSDISTILRQIADALDYAHRNGIVHRDIKPNNVLLDEQGNAYLADFGLARMLETSSDQNMTATGSLLGTPTYVAPEQIQHAWYDERSDIYSLGVVLYEMVTGRPPFMNESIFTTLRAHVEQPPPPVHRFRPDLPLEVQDVLAKALDKDPNKRYQHAAEMAEAFYRAAQADMTTDRIPRLIADTTIKLPRITLSRMPLFGASVITVVLLLVLGAFALRPVLMPAVPLTLSDQQRPATGTPDDLKPTNAEITRARASLNNSFIGMMACALSTDYHASLARAVRIRAQTYNLPVRVEDSQADKFRQPAIINSFVAQGAKVIIACEIDEQSTAPALTAARQAGVQVIRFADVSTDRTSVTITFSNEDMGRLVGTYTADVINREMGGDAVVAILDYPPATATIRRADAMQATLLKKAQNVKIVGHWLGGLPDNGEQSMTEALQQHPDINVIMSINDAGAYGAIKALRKAGKKPGDVMIVSVDAETEAQRMMRAGDFFRASVDSGAVASGEDAVDAAVKLLAGSIVPRQIFLPGTIVTREMILAATPDGKQ